MFKKVKETFIGIFVVVVLIIIVAGVYKHETGKGNRALAKRIAELSPRGGPPETIEGLRSAIALYQAQIERNVNEGAQTGVYWKILGIRLADRGMHRDALDAFERAIYFNSEDATLFHLTGESAMIVAASSLAFSPNSDADRERFLNIAEGAFRRAIQLDVTYSKPLYGLGYLYTFEMSREAEAIPYLERYLQLLPNDIKGMFVLARAYFVTKAYDDAVNLYDRIIARSKDPRVRAEAENNKDTIRNLIYGL
ncbi:MAG: tetratricopeptide repeat protein [Treponema sp.]|nr:tetratricopeptide repeat protein [Treponema sp.]